MNDVAAGLVLACFFRRGGRVAEGGGLEISATTVHNKSEVARAYIDG